MKICLPALANRLTRLDKQITEKERTHFMEKTGGVSISQVVKDLLSAYNPDIVEELQTQVEEEMKGAAPVEKEAKFNQAWKELQDNAAKVFNGELNEYIENVRKAHDQKIDLLNPDEVLNAGWDKENKEKRPADRQRLQRMGGSP